ncbi:GNAT family N-acetyltransferase [Rhodococcus pyridinivorans]|nr:GNAT family N-acetyltransferase [Rhodococcus pyridinivorans]
MQITVVHPRELGESELATWRCIQHENPGVANPFLSPEFTLAVGRLRRQARVAVLSDGPKTVGFLPFELSAFGVGMPIAGRINGCQGVVHVPGLEWDAQQLIHECGMAVWQFDHLLSEQNAFASYHRRKSPSPIMDLSGGYDAFMTDLLRKSSTPAAYRPRLSLKELAYKERRLARDIGDLRFIFDSHDPQALRTLISWKTAHYQRTGATDMFARPWVIGLLEELLETRTEHFTGILSGLYAGDRLLAVQFGLRCGEVLAGWHLTYNIALPRYSPGLIQILHLARAAADAGIQQIDMGRGAAEYKTLFSSQDPLVAEGQVVTRSRGATLHSVRYASEHWARRFVREHPPLFGPVQRARNNVARIDSTVRRRWQRRMGDGSVPGATSNVAAQGATRSEV